METAPSGLHHITVIAGDARENLAFYTEVLGMRLVKRSVNQDDPGTYHLFYADGAGTPGTDLTFFPWPQLAPVQKGVGLTDEVLLAVPPGSLERWRERLEQHGVTPSPLTTRFGERTVRFRDPHGLDLALVETADERPFAPWTGSPVPAAEQIRGLHGARLLERELAPSEHFLTEVMGFARIGEEDGWVRFGLPDDAGKVGGSRYLLDLRAEPGTRRGQWGVGGVHHLAWSVRDAEQQLALRAQVALAGRRPSEVIDRFWFRSVYFMEPGGVLFELATLGPGFTVDEDAAHLGERLILPPWLEPHRARIEAALPSLEPTETAEEPQDVRASEGAGS